MDRAEYLAKERIRWRRRREDKDTYDKYLKIRRDTKAVNLMLIKESQPCYDCGKFFPYYQTEFDHCRGVKKFNIANYSNITALLDELEKCDLVCCNCHAIRTHFRRSGIPTPWIK